MKKFLLPLLLLIVLTGCILNPNGQKFDDETVEKAKEVVEKYLRSNFEEVEKIEFDKDDPVSPMGGMLISGSVNGRGKFSVSVDTSLNVSGMSYSDDFPKLKEECKDKKCD